MKGNIVATQNLQPHRRLWTLVFSLCLALQFLLMENYHQH